VRAAVTRHVVVEVLAPQAMWAVVAVPGARRIDGYVKPAVTASERVRTAGPGTVALIARQEGPPVSVLEPTENASPRAQPWRRGVMSSVVALIGRHLPKRPAASWAFRSEWSGESNRLSTARQRHHL
jgi:hypothetical protein